MFFPFRAICMLYTLRHRFGSMLNIVDFFVMDFQYPNSNPFLCIPFWQTAASVTHRLR